MTRERLVEVLEATAGLDVWLAGGWGVDALVGEQTRAHHDADLLVRTEQVDAVAAAVARIGFHVVVDERPDHVLLEDAAGRRLDLQLLTFTESGDAFLCGDDGWFELFPRDGFTEGRVGERVVGCLSGAVQIEKHGGYELRNVDRQDLALLRKLIQLNDEKDPT